MSVSMYASRVNALTGDLASLRAKLADARTRFADDNAKALKAVEALSKAKTPSQFSSKRRDVERYQKATAAQETRIGEIEKQIVAKQKSLKSAEESLARAKKEEVKKDEREAEKRRRADIDHLKQMERERRSITPLPEGFAARPRAQVLSRAMVRRSGPAETYDVCLSFAGEQRDYVEMIAAELKKAGRKVFYDQDEEIAPTIWGRDLGEYLDYIYREASRFCLMFISEDYANKAWTRHERRSALARMIEDGSDYLLPARFDDTQLPGLRPTIAYVDLRQIAPAVLVDFVLRKLDAAA